MRTSASFFVTSRNVCAVCIIFDRPILPLQYVVTETEDSRKLSDLELYDKLLERLQCECIRELTTEGEFTHKL